MQIDDIAPQIVPLPEPPVWERYLLESPIAVVAALALAGVVALLMFNARAKIKIGAVVCVALLALAGGVWALASAVVTPRERLIERARGVIGATAEADVAALHPMLAERVEVRVGERTRYTGRGEVLRGVEEYPGGRFSVESHRVAEAQAVIDGPRTARTQLRVRHTGPSLPIASWWLIEWRRESEDSPWIVETIEPLWISGYGNLR